MAKWGRSAGLAEFGEERRGYSRGAKSIFCAILALALVVLALAFMVSLPKDASELTTNIATFGLVAAYFVAAPLLHIVGAVFALAGLFRVDDRRVLCVLGIILNVGLVGLGALLGFAALAGIGAYT